jgi:hypothetical protein
MIQTIAPTAAPRADASEEGQIEIEDSPMPAPSVISRSPMAAVTKAPAITAGQETPDVLLSS